MKLYTLCIVLLIIVLTAGCGRSEPTQTSVDNRVPPTLVPSPTPIPTATRTPVPTATPAPAILDIDPTIIALTFEDIPPGFAIDREINNYTSPEYEPQNIKPEALRGLKRGYGVTFLKEAGLQDLFSILAIANINFIYESEEAAQKALELIPYVLPDAELKRVSAPRLGDQSIAYIMRDSSPDDSGDTTELVAYTVVFRIKNILVIVVGGGMAGAGSIDQVAEWAATVEQRIQQIASP
ncbi:MAG: hypothetical protein D6706_20125 [Chloroflexi bacterium]|nr:MAG: hypothetical protein D6706_20125 [Chloroflexota bacterium]